MPAYIGNGHPQFFLFIELAGGDDEKVLVEQRSHKTSLFGLADLGEQKRGRESFILLTRSLWLLPSGMKIVSWRRRSSNSIQYTMAMVAKKAYLGFCDFISRSASW